MTHVYIYTRRSTPRQETSLERQRAQCEAHATAQGWRVSRVFSDTCSGRVPAVKRSGLGELLDVLSAGDTILASARDRVGRDAMDNTLTERHIERVGARLITLDAETDASPESALLRSMLDMVAQYEQALLSRRVRATLRAKRERGERTGTVPLGYREVDGHIVPNEEERAQIERARELRAQGLSFTRLHEACKREGIKTRRGTTPSAGTLCKWCRGVEVSRVKRKPRSPNVNPRKPHRARRSVNELHPQLVYVIQDLREKGLSLRAITDELTRRGYRTSKGGAYCITQIARILKRADTREPMCSKPSSAAAQSVERQTSSACDQLSLFECEATRHQSGVLGSDSK
jgi:DNA invertase Pin-like site-specific DNA recombinase